MSTTTSELPGQERAEAQLAAAAERPVPAYLFVGSTGWGTRRAAVGFAGELLARRDPDGADRHRRLAEAETHPAVTVVERTGASISVEEARSIARAAEMAPPEGDHQVLVLVDFHLVRDAAPALLKTIEEPPAGTTFIVLAEEVTPELTTIASRCLRVDFHPIPVPELLDAVVREGFDPEAAQMAATAAGGDLDRLRALLSDDAAARRWTAWAQVPDRLDGTPATASAVVRERLEDLDAAGESLAERHRTQLEAFDAADEGARGQSGRRARLEARHSRESRRFRNDSLRVGLTALAATLRAGDADRYRRAGEAFERFDRAMVHNAREDLALLALVLGIGPR